MKFPNNEIALFSMLGNDDVANSLLEVLDKEESKGKRSKNIRYTEKILDDFKNIDNVREFRKILKEKYPDFHSQIRGAYSGTERREKFAQIMSNLNKIKEKIAKSRKREYYEYNLDKGTDLILQENPTVKKDIIKLKKHLKEKLDAGQPIKDFTRKIGDKSKITQLLKIIRKNETKKVTVNNFFNDNVINVSRVLVKTPDESKVFDIYQESEKKNMDKFMRKAGKDNFERIPSIFAKVFIETSRKLKALSRKVNIGDFEAQKLVENTSISGPARVNTYLSLIKKSPKGAVLGDFLVTINGNSANNDNILTKRKGNSYLVMPFLDTILRGRTDFADMMEVSETQSLMTMNTFLRANFDSYNKKARADIKSAIDSKNVDVESENFEVSRFAREYYELIGKGSNILIVPQQIKEYSVETDIEENKFRKIGDGKFFKVTDKETKDILNRYRDSDRIKKRVRKYFSEEKIDENEDTKMFLDSTIEEKDDTKIPEKIKTKLQKKLYNYFTEMKDNDIPITANLIGEKLSETEFKEEKLTEKVRLKALILAINRYTNINLSPAINDIEDEEDISDGVIELAKDIETGIDEFRNNFIEAVDNKITDFVENPDRYIKLYSNDRFMDRIKALKLVMEEK